MCIVDSYRSSPREFPEHLAPVEYLPGDLVRKTDTNGHISLPGRQVRIGKGLVGQAVACRPVQSEDGVYEVCFCFYRLGRIDLNDFCQTARKTVNHVPAQVLPLCPVCTLGHRGGSLVCCGIFGFRRPPARCPSAASAVWR
ncbi:hypothetical protein [Neisseria sp. KEM232]|uniref:hypothetical protein n=1 Tax=Neisseria sp. KEM232 TaxID=655307 RepID=UPI0018DF2FFF|nr:hypothetical protein [Neisseria sp. KEM232]